MKILTLFFINISILNGLSQENVLSQLKSCKIEFVYGTPTYKGKKILIIADSGRIEKTIDVQFVDTSAVKTLLPQNFSQKNRIFQRTNYKSMIIQTLDSVFMIDLDSMICSSQPRIQIFSQQFFDKNLKKIGEDTFLNRKCDIMDFHGAKIWYWKGIALKKEFPINLNECNNCVYEYAVSIDEKYLIKEDEFKVPRNVTMK